MGTVIFILIMALLVYYWAFILAPVLMFRYRVQLMSEIITESFSRAKKNQKLMGDIDDEPSDMG